MRGTVRGIVGVDYQAGDGMNAHLLDGIEVDAREYDLLVQHSNELLHLAKMVVRLGIEAKRAFPQQITLNAGCALFETARKALGDE